MTLFAQLIENLTLQAELHDALLEAIKAESELPASCTVIELEELHAARDMAVQNIARLEKKRLSLVETMPEQQATTQPLQLKELIKMSHGNDKKQLTELREQLKIILEEIKAISQKNASRAMSRIACFNEIQGITQRALKRSPTYSGRGILNRPKGAYFVKRSI